MQVQTALSSFSNPYASSYAAPSASPQENSASVQNSAIKNEYHLIAENLSPSERKLYDNLIYAENYEAAKGIVAIGFLRAAGLYQDSEGNKLEGVSLREDLTRLLPPSDPSQQKAVVKLQEYLLLHPSALEPNAETKGNLIDFKV